MNKKPIRSFRDLEVFQNAYRASIEIAKSVLPMLPANEKQDLYNQLSRSSKAIPRLISEGFAKKHQKSGFQRYLDEAMAECNETIVSLEHIKDIYGIEIEVCDELIKLYDICARQLFNLAQAWDKFKHRKYKTMPYDHTGNNVQEPNTTMPLLFHIAIAVKGFNGSLKFWQEIMGFKLVAIEEIPEQKVRVAILELNKIHIELLEPSSPDSTVARFIEKRGEGLHHIAFEVDNIEETLDNLKKSGVKLIDEKPRSGAQGSKIAFIHPQSTGGVLVELCQH